MNKRAFLKLLSTLMAMPVVSPVLAWALGEKLKNWAGNIEYSTERLYSPSSSEQVRDFVGKQAKLKVLGTRHCFNGIADSADYLLSLKAMDKVITLDPSARTVTIEAGMAYGQLCPYLDGKGFALHNLASLPHISVAGACSTATHGSATKRALILVCPQNRLGSLCLWLVFCRRNEPLPTDRKSTAGLSSVIDLKNEFTGDIERNWQGNYWMAGAIGIRRRIVLDHTDPPFLVLCAENAALYTVSITNAVPPVIDRLPEEA